VLVDKIASGVFTQEVYLSTAGILAMAPRSLVLLAVNLAVGAVAVWWISLMGRRERERLAALDHQRISVDAGAAQQAK
jgi:hypothetical protein